MKYFDAHCHIQLAPYDSDRSEIISAMDEQGIGGLVVGVDMDSSQKAFALAQKHEHLFAAVGLHPNDTPEEEFNREGFLELLSHKEVVAIGECGLDNYRPENPEEEKKRQQSVFEAHVELAVQTKKPLMIHARPSKGTQDAYTDLIEILKSAKHEHGDALSGNVHFFVGGIDEARALVELDFTVSYTAVLTFTHEYDDVVRFVPLSHLITETDSPYVSPAPNRGKRNDPRTIPAIIEAISGIRGEDSETVRVNILQNAHRVFTLS